MGFTLRRELAALDVGHVQRALNQDSKCSPPRLITLHGLLAVAAEWLRPRP